MFACACCGRLSAYFTKQTQPAGHLRVSEQYADGVIAATVVEEAFNEAASVCEELHSEEADEVASCTRRQRFCGLLVNEVYFGQALWRFDRNGQGRCKEEACSTRRSDPGRNSSEARNRRRESRCAPESIAQTTLLRDVFGSPFPPGSLHIGLAHGHRRYPRAADVRIARVRRDAHSRRRAPGRGLRQRRYPRPLSRKQSTYPRMLGGRSGVGERVMPSK